MQSALDQQTTEAGAVDEQFAVDARTVLQLHRFDEAIGAAQLDVDNLAFDTPHTLGLGTLTQILRVKAGIEMEGVRDVRQRRVFDLGRTHELVLLRRDGIEGVIIQRTRFAKRAQLQPVVVELHHAEIAPTDSAEGVVIGVPKASPVLEFDAEFEGALRGTQELVFINTHARIEAADRWNGRFADTNDANLVRLDQGDVDDTRKHLDQGGGGHPAGSSSTNNDDLANGIRMQIHGLSLFAVPDARGHVCLAW